MATQSGRLFAKEGVTFDTKQGVFIKKGKRIESELLKGLGPDSYAAQNVTSILPQSELGEFLTVGQDTSETPEQLKRRKEKELQESILSNTQGVRQQSVLAGI